ncbi:MAG: transposase [bacterium]|nr:transposase [bacterium]
MCELLAWVVLEDHYHFLVKCSEGKYIPKLMNLVHGRVSYKINKIDNKRGRFVFNNYWDRIIRDQVDLNIHIKYILYNPVKHGYVDNPKDYNMVWVKGLKDREIIS